MSPTAPGTETTAARWPRACLVAVAALGAAIFVLPLLLHTPLLDPDEGLHAAIAREMVAGGDWVTPRLLGEPFLDKPALYFWGLAASIVALGPNEAAVRLPGLLFGALGAVAAALLARRLFGRTAGALALVFQASMLLPLALTQIAVHDVAVVPWTTLAILALYSASQSRSTRHTLGWGGVAGMWLGLAVLAKGLTGVALVGLPFALWCLVHRQLRWALVLAGTVSLLVGAALAWPWYAAMEAANPGYLHYYFVERHLLGYTTTSQLHGGRPWWYYLPVLVVGSLPWLPYVHRPLGELIRAWPQRDRASDVSALSLLVIWICADVAFLSLAGSKLVTYVLPVMPAIAVLAARAWSEALARPDAPTPKAWRMSHVVACVAMAASLPAAVAISQEWLIVGVSPVRGAVGATSMLLWVVVAAFALRLRPWQTLTAMVGATALTIVAGLSVVLPAVAPAFTARELARYYNREGRLPGTIWFYDERVGSFLFYLDASLRSGLTPGRVVHGRPEVLLGLRQAPPDTVIVIPVEHLPRLERRIPLANRPFVQAGHHRAYDAGEFVGALREAVDGR